MRRMDHRLHLRFANTAILTGLALLYLVYDTGFRFWMSQNDAAMLSATLLRNPAALKNTRGVGLAFEAAAEVTTAPALQTHLFNSHRWTRVAATTDDGTGSEDATAAAADLPMAAVVVESSWLSPDHAGVSVPYAQRLLEGYRYALLTGAPWLLLAGSAEESALGLQHLRRLADPAEALFGASAVTRWPVELKRLAEALYDSMLPYSTLGAWMHGVGSRPIPTFLSSPLPASHTSPQHPAALRAALRHLLSVTSLTDMAAGGARGRPFALVLAAEWLHRRDATRSRVEGGTMDSTAAAAAAAAAEPHVTVYATAAAVIKEDVVAGEEEEEEENGEDDIDGGSWETARVRLLHLNGTHRPVHLTIPGIVAVTAPSEKARARYAVTALQHLLEKALVHRHALQGTTTAAAKEEEAAWWWWLAQPYGVAVVGGAWEQQRIKLIYTKALREAAADEQARLRRAVQDIHHTRCQFEGGTHTVTMRLPADALPFAAAAVPRPPKVFIVPPGVEEAPTAEQQPVWLNYTGELPATIHADASRAARWIGRWSFFLYVNYRRWMDWFLASLPAGVYQDHFVLASVLMSDLAEHRISWRDAFYAL